MCNQSTWSNLWNCIRRTYLTIKNHQRKFYKILTSWRIQNTKTKLDDKKQCFYFPVKFLVTHEYKKPKRWHANMYMISQKNYNHLFATKHMWKAGKIKVITYPRKGTCVCKHLFITYPAVFFKNRIYTVPASFSEVTYLVNLLRKRVYHMGLNMIIVTIKHGHVSKIWEIQNVTLSSFSILILHSDIRKALIGN